jgi:hypothetical protein
MFNLVLETLSVQAAFRGAPGLKEAERRTALQGGPF